MSCLGSAKPIAYDATLESDLDTAAGSRTLKPPRKTCRAAPDACPVSHTTTLLKNLGVPARDAQIILGHSQLAVTLEIYTHENRQAQRQALGRISEALGYGSEPSTVDTADRQ